MKYVASALTRRKSSASASRLRLVDTLADRWGIDVDGTGKTVWFEILRSSTERPA